MFKVASLLFLCVVFLAASICESSQSAGSLRNKKGDVTVQRDGESREADDGSLIYPDDSIRTGNDGSVGIIFRDNSRISLGPNSRLDIKKFVFEPSSGGFSFVSRLIKGIASLVSGKMTKLSPEAVVLETPTSTIGVRGTSYHVMVKGEE